MLKSFSLICCKLLIFLLLLTHHSTYGQGKVKLPIDYEKFRHEFSNVVLKSYYIDSCAFLSIFVSVRIDSLGNILTADIRKSHNLDMQFNELICKNIVKKYNMKDIYDLHSAKSYKGIVFFTIFYKSEPQ